METLFYIIAGILGLCVIMVTAVTIQVIALSRAQLQRVNVEDPNSDYRTKTTMPTNVWAQRNDFEHVGYFKLSTYFFSAWQHTQRPTFLCHHVLPKNAIEFITVFDDDITFSTVSNASWHDSPQFPGYYIQTFSQKEPQSLWHQHIQMENYLMDVGKAELVHLDLTCQDCLNYYLRKQTSFIRSIPLWPIRALYWAFVRKNKWHNKSIKTQHELGMILLPSEAQTSPSIQTLR